MRRFDVTAFGESMLRLGIALAALALSQYDDMVITTSDEVRSLLAVDGRRVTR